MRFRTAELYTARPRISFVLFAAALVVTWAVPRGLTTEQVVDAGQRSIEHLSNGDVWRRCSDGATYKPEECRTLNPARYFGIEQTAGSVASGRRADLVLLEANPLSDIANVRRIRAVIVAGRLLDRQALDATLAQAKAAAAR